ncbi:MAG: hypothetical protein EOM14_13790 [Clostridia bacterium]|nr:hypothetical protein [Clostridia bacterium]
MNYAAVAAEIFVMALLGCVGLCLFFYASMAVGHGFTKHKILMSIVFFFVFQFALQIIGTIIVSVWGEMPYFNITPENMMSLWHAVAGIAVAAELVYCAVFYFITTFSLKKRLNLE